MAVLEMRRLGFVGPSGFEERLLDRLQDLALVEPVPLTEVETPAELLAERAGVERTISALEHAVEIATDDLLERRTELAPLEADALRAEVEALLTRQAETSNELLGLRSQLHTLTPFAENFPADVAELERAGAHLSSYLVDEEKLAQIDLAAVDWYHSWPLAQRSKQHCLVVLKLDGPAEIEADPIVLPRRSATQLRERIKARQATLADCESRLVSLALQIPTLERQRARIADRLARAEARNGMKSEAELFALSGWCPAESVDRVQAAISDLPVAMTERAPQAEEHPPVALRNNALVRLFEPLLKAFNLPHYREADPTAFIAPFMGIFFGFCLGDMGYGLILTLLAGLALVKLKPRGELGTVARWMVLLGVCTVIIGGLMGNLFGMRLYDESDPESTRALLFRLSADPTLFFYASLGFGIIQIMIGIGIRLFRQLRARSWQEAVGTVGWLSLIPSIGAWVVYDIGWTPLASVGLIFFFSSPHPSLGRRIGGGAWALYQISGLFGDVMSYARIFGLGLSSGIIAGVINIIAASVSGGVVGWVAAGLILVVGHGFNFAMATIGAVVHPARLQFLEFFNKFFEGAGRPYSPLRKVAGE